MHAREDNLRRRRAGGGSATRGARVGAAAPPPPPTRRRCAFYGGGRAPPRAGVRGWAGGRPRCTLAAWWRTKIRPELSELGPPPVLMHVKDGPVRRNDYRTAPGAFSTLYFRIIAALSADCTSICECQRVADFANFALETFHCRPAKSGSLNIQNCFGFADNKSRKAPSCPLCVSPEHISQGHLRARFAKGEGCAGILRSVTNRTQIALS
jgi:hypothetical protein